MKRYMCGIVGRHYMFVISDGSNDDNERVVHVEGCTDPDRQVSEDFKSLEAALDYLWETFDGKIWIRPFEQYDRENQLKHLDEVLSGE